MISEYELIEMEKRNRSATNILSDSILVAPEDSGLDEYYQIAEIDTIAHVLEDQDRLIEDYRSLRVSYQYNKDLTSR